MSCFFFPSHSLQRPITVSNLHVSPSSPLSHFPSHVPCCSDPLAFSNCPDVTHRPSPASPSQHMYSLLPGRPPLLLNSSWVSCFYIQPNRTSCHTIMPTSAQCFFLFAESLLTTKNRTTFLVFGFKTKLFLKSSNSIPYQET